MFSDIEFCNETLQNLNIIPYIKKKSTYVEGSKTCLYGVAKLTDGIQKYIDCQTKTNGTRPIYMFRVICKDPRVKEPKIKTCPTFLKRNKNYNVNNIKCLEVCFKFRFDQIVFCKGKPISYFFKYLKVSISLLAIFFVGVFIWWKIYEIKVSFFILKIYLPIILTYLNITKNDFIAMFKVFITKFH